MPFCSDDFPGQYKRVCNALSTSVLIHCSSRTDHQHEESAFQLWVIFPLGDYSFIIYSFLLDQLDLETSG